MKGGTNSIFYHSKLTCEKTFNLSKPRSTEIKESTDTRIFMHWTEGLQEAASERVQRIKYFQLPTTLMSGN